MSLEVVLITIAATGVAFLAGLPLVKNRGLTKVTRRPGASYEELGEFLGKEDREMLLK